MSKATWVLLAAGIIVLSLLMGGAGAFIGNMVDTSNPSDIPAPNQVIPGTDGRDGPQGIPGRDGRDGKDGAPGPVGPQGPPGADGSRGETGPAGPQGAAGRDGSPGADGQDGRDGENGAMGPPGANGKDGKSASPCPEGEIPGKEWIVPDQSYRLTCEMKEEGDASD